MIDPELLELMPDTVIIEPRIGLDGYNNALYGPGVEVQARVESKPRIIRDITGREVVSMAKTILAVPLDVKPTARITLPRNDKPQVILSVSSSPDELGPYCVVIYT